MKKLKFKIPQSLFLALFLFFPFAIFASATDGMIDSTYRWAWGENIGWIDFGTSTGNVHITDSGLSGYALSETVGWIYLGDVDNDNEGNLSGYAWSENAGWINFNPANGGVVIDSSGYFTGSALGENIGWIIFDGDYKVKTDWRQASVRAVSDSAGGGGGSSPKKLPLPPKAPHGGFGVLINNGDKYAKERTVNLKLFGGSDVVKMEISVNPDLADSTGIIAYSQEYEFNICGGEGDCLDGEHFAYAKFYTKEDQPSLIVSDGIILDRMAPKTEIFGLKEYFYPDEDIFIFGRTTEPLVEITLHWDKKYGSVGANDQGIWSVNLGKLPAGDYLLEMFARDLAGNIGQAENIDLKIKERLAIEPEEPASGEAKPEIPSEIIVPEKPAEIITVPEAAPVSMQGKWNLLPPESIKEFVLAPLPKNVRELAAKFPELEKTFEKVGVSKATDIKKLQNIKLTVPTLSSIKGVPLAKLTPEAKQQLPVEIIFAKSGGELIDFNVGFSITEKGDSWQKITTVSGKPLQLAVKPDSPAKTVKGYIVFNSRKIARGYEKPLNRLTASLMGFIEEKEKSVRSEEKLVLSQFEYFDEDGDGIYTAKIQSPIIEGEYEIITIIDYVSVDLGKKELRLITIVDPEGYVFEKMANKEARIPEAEVSIFWKNPGTGGYELWPASKYQQENPQTTDNTGKYSFLVPEGSYYITAEAPGYKSYEGEPFEVKEGKGVHFNIELEGKYAWLKVFDWKIILLLVIFVLVLYNFYRDNKKRKI
ncbi:MAG: carboxypeptidase regulatory-like domain-containing protein [bacterium]|nr:carboxypeptidase regulatory-like domain-containing protein [bacterium]